MKKKILIIADASTPNNGARGIQAYKIIRGLIDYFEVWLITSSRAKQKVYFKSLITNNRIFFYSHDNTSFIEKVIKKFYTPIQLVNRSYIKNAYKRAVDIINTEEINLVLTFSVDYSNAIVGNKLKHSISRIKLFQFLSDPIVDNVYNNRNWMEGLFYGKLEKVLIQKSDKIIVPSFRMKKLIQDKGARQVAVVPHAFDPEKVLQEEKKNKLFVISYFGSFSISRNPLILLDFIENNQNVLGENSIAFEFYGTLSKDMKRKVLLKAEKLNHVQFHERIPYSSVKQLMQKTNALLLIDAPIENSPFFPSKLAEYMAFGHPIIAITPISSETKRIVDSIGQYTITQSEMPSKFLSLLLKVKKNPAFNYSLVKNYHIESVLKQWISLMEDMNA